MWRTPDIPVRRRRPPPTTSSSTSAPGVCWPGPQACVGEPQPRGTWPSIGPDLGPDRKQHPRQEPARSFLWGQDGWDEAEASRTLVILQPLRSFPLWAQLWRGQDSGLWWTPEGEPKFCGVVYSSSQSDFVTQTCVQSRTQWASSGLTASCHTLGPAPMLTASLLLSLENSTSNADVPSNKFVFGQNMSERVLVSGPCGAYSSGAQKGFGAPAPLPGQRDMVWQPHCFL